MRVNWPPLAGCDMCLLNPHRLLSCEMCATSVEYSWSVASIDALLIVGSGSLGLELILQSQVELLLRSLP